MNSTKPGAGKESSGETGLEPEVKPIEEVIECPNPVQPDGFTLSELPDEKYFRDMIEPHLIEQAEDLRKKATNDASANKEAGKAAVKETYQTAENEYARAERARDSEIKNLETKIKNNKTEHKRIYKEKLIGLLPKECPTAGRDPSSSTIEQRIAQDILAICIAELSKSIEDENLLHLQELKKIKNKFADGVNIWEKAKIGRAHV